MSATADKARYFLEQSVPELKEFEKKKLFNPDEIRSIAKKRSDFEHKINARNSTSSDYAQYAEFEINVDALRKKRVKRLGVKSTTYNGQRRIYFVFDRGTRKFPGDLGLWMQYIEYARRQKAYKKLMQIFTSVLRLHPTKSELWIYAAQFAIDENGDMTEARSYMQRGLRFCKNNKSIWLEYARLELAYMAKIHARRQVLGIRDDKDNDADSKDQDQDQDEDGDVLRLPALTEEDINPDRGNTYDIDETALQNLDHTPAMSGAIPQAVFDSAMTHFHYDASVAHMFFDTVSEFSNLKATPRILDHILDTLQTHAASHWQTQACLISRPLLGIPYDRPEFAIALRESIKRARDALSPNTQAKDLRSWYQGWLRKQIHADMDEALHRVISAQLQSLD